MSTMYSRSVVMLEQAQNALEHVTLDDAFLDVACFETQQAVKRVHNIYKSMNEKFLQIQEKNQE